MKRFYELQEGVYDPGIFKAFFLAGGPGSGKSYVTSRITPGLGLKNVNSDTAFENALKRMSKEKVNTDWQNLMSPFFELPEGAHPDKNMIEWEEVFHLD